MADSTLKQYESTYRFWWNFCQCHNINYFEASEQDVIKFLNEQFQTKLLKYGSFNTYRSALSLILDVDIGKRPNIRRFMKGIFKLRPPKRRYNYIWDANVVLNHLETKTPNENLDLMALTRKTVTLLALISGHRLQTLARIRVDNILISPSGIQILISDQIKTTNTNNEQPCLQIPYFRHRPGICPASCLEAYIIQTAINRSERQDFLFLTTRPPYQTASTGTISNWIKATLSEAGINTEIFTAYSTRHTASSAAFNNGATLQAIRRTAGWTDSSQMFARHYHLPIQDLQEFAKALVK